MRGYWRNVSGPFYGAATDSTMLGRLDALRQISYADDPGGGFVGVRGPPRRGAGGVPAGVRPPARPETDAPSVGGAAEALGVQAAR
ncbi:hypothetical protein OIE52_25540 [Streptomyces canus]|uniref:hypothetical protein n=1 Tax=Streptomyces canus TaxID=58343 RepID=UPI002E2944A9|nr:hypothetical protein [Streptomyces canus]